ncbi:MAG: glycosyltransferase [Candidatus Shapirobacteria bacterium]
MAISIIIPCYNEENNLKRGVLNEVSDYLDTAKFKYEVLICNDASTDNSLKLAQTFAASHPGFKVLDLPHGGKPSALLGGIKQAAYPWVLFSDMDQSTPLNQLEKFLPFMDSYDVIIGSRGTEREGNTLLRKIGANVFLNIRRLFLLPEVTDTQCGFKAMKTELAVSIFPRLSAVVTASANSGWRVTAYDVEMLFLAHLNGKKIKEIPVDWRNEDTSTTKGDLAARYRKESIQMAKELWRVKLNHLRGVYR